MFFAQSMQHSTPPARLLCASLRFLQSIGRTSNYFLFKTHRFKYIRLEGILLHYKVCRSRSLYATLHISQM
jgi:hypothetical protein